MINIDTSTALTFVAENSPVRHQLKAFVNGRPMFMTQTAYDEFQTIVTTVGGPLEQARANRFLTKVTIIPDDPSARAMALTSIGSVGDHDKIIFGTGDNLGYTTMSGDRRFVRGARMQGVDFDVYLHPTERLSGR